MLPSLLARDIQQGLQQFLITGFEPSDDFMHGVMSRFVQDQSGWLKGPYLQVGLPFTTGKAGRKFFSGFETEFPGHSHQEAAWKRLSSQMLADHTLVATGTGSGKTECFLYPVLDHCSHMRKAGGADSSGIKALVIYPMNALASDQARRFAQLVASTPAFAGLRVGLYVGGAVADPGQGMVMTPTNVITDRDTLRKNPPDILLTNYKMLDYLLLRPKDRKLWERNTPTTLRYLVVDELHTFDGAQGTDLALLLRRLRARLKSPPGHLICAGTSATLGGASDTAALRDYARQIFGAPFGPESVITENRQSVGVFLEDAFVEFMFQSPPDLAGVLDSAQFKTPGQAVAKWFELFFPDEPKPADVTDVAWRIQLSDCLKRHILFVNLLKQLKGGVVHYDELTDRLHKNLPVAAHGQVREVLDALLVLVAWARLPGVTPDKPIPLVSLRLQLWMRELRRMVAKLAVESDDVRLRSSADVAANPDGVYLPLIQCSECHTTGWLSRLVQGSNKLSTKLDEIYNTWFAGRPEATRLYAASSVKRPQVEGVVQHACVACGNLQQGPGTCQACGQQDLLAVYKVIAQRSFSIGQVQHTRHDNTCPACGNRDRLLLLGARNATLGSQVVEHSWASPFNDDKKLIAFSDSVQDAAHRAGFFGARTYLNNVRTALAKVIDELARPSLSWSDFLAQADALFDTPGSVLNMSPERLLSEFIGPNMTWQRDWAEELLKKGALPASSRLPAKVRKRLLWQAYSEFTYLSHRGRNLERIGKATVSVPLDRVTAAAELLLPTLQEEFDGKGLSLEVLTQWLWGLLTHMRRRGAVMHPELTTYAGDGNVYALTNTGGRREWLPSMGERTPRPVLLTLGKQRDFDKLTNAHKTSWFDRWAAAALGRQMLLSPGMAVDLFNAAAKVLESQSILVRTVDHQGDTLAINPLALQIDTQTTYLATPLGKRRLTVPASAAPALQGMPCIDATDEFYDDMLPTGGWLSDRFSQGDLRRVIAAEHTGLLEREEREALEIRFKSKQPRDWYENLLSATPTLEMGVDIGDLSSVLLCSVPPNQASFLQRMGRAGRRDGNAMTTTLADGSSPHDLYFFEETQEMLSGEVTPPGVFLKAAEVLRRQLFAFCMDDWVSGISSATAFPEKTSTALDAVEQVNQARFPYNFCDHVLAHEPRLFGAFIDLLGSDVDAMVRQRLQDFLQGQGDVDGLRSRLLKYLQELVEERKTYKKRKDQIDVLRKSAEQRPQDEATRAEIDGLLRERDKMLELIAEINKRDLLNTLTDAGLIPNYAFPEAGIELKSVLWRKRGADEQGQGTYVALPAIKYERPANSALSEFAPENRFYANQRKVEIDQINMNLANTEEWRFCPSCHHMQNLEVEADTHVVCPRCGDDMWADAAQKRTLLRFRQAIANSDDTKVRIDDSADDREPKFFVRQLMADFDQKDIREAWQIKTGGLPFGFEFVSRVTFRDVNFGELVKPGESFRVADKESSRPGFKLCKHCGKVQAPPKNRFEPAGQHHSFDCVKHGNEDPANLLECLYLYREFTSEALRILVPYTKSGVDDEVVQSFMAALQLGLKRRFGGRVDHLRLVTQDEPGKDGGPRRHFVMLYDSVPGGTGYLHQLLAQDAGTLADVLRMALESINKCSCNDDPEKDGCYRCVYQYRLGRNMLLVSRDRGKEVLTELVASLDQLEKVATISDIFINPNFDSVLESRFIESLRRMGGASGLPPVKLVQDIVNGKSGFVLELSGQRYRIEPQCNFGPSEGVAVASKPDFVIWPWQSGSARKPIAVFCDGWTYHQNSLREDALKRSALVASGKFWVWSVTHEDVKAALSGAIATDLDSPLVMANRHDGSKAPVSLPRAVQGAFSHQAVFQLLNWLASPIVPGSDVDAAVTQMQRNALWLGFLMVPSKPAELPQVQNDLAAWMQQLPEWLQHPGKGYAPSLSRKDFYPVIAASWPLACAQGKTEGLTSPGVLVLDDLLDQTEQLPHLYWRRWLALFNTLQTLPGLVMTTTSGIQAGDIERLIVSPAKPTAPAGSADQAALSQEWAELLDLTLETLKAGLHELAMMGAQPPMIGHELADEHGAVIAEAEMAWPTKHVVLLTFEQADMTDVWVMAGWQALVLDEPNPTVEGIAWSEAVATKLGMMGLHKTDEGVSA
ncbi:DEAD/DEAH box helicase [Rhodoferax fermentans]|uniref:DEAD/DEAH box helicase n=1 Tax=Rhodoferax fermentans TaxID=28066 RepID=A0A1T1AMH1_RHOFE|nr:DEAD/DEAH box helicase [Rhodoferax fermentans]MBK1683926.1 DEAD/DEAH box helicase [Rhodoferax fermentans]OOV05356.1 DEAD/DEAH box helicase [Rhodoferax fermentans]